MARISADQIGLRDAADIFGVSIDTLRRRIRDNQLDEALLVQGPFGATWVLPKDSLDLIAEREGWDNAADPVVDATPPNTVDESTVSRVSVPMHSPGQALASVAQHTVTGASNSAESAVGSATNADSFVPAPSAAEVIDLTHVDQSGGAAQADLAPPNPPETLSPPDAEPGPVASESLIQDLTAVVAAEVAKGLSDNVHAELSAVREAITAAEVKAVAADARTDALRAEKGRLEAQLKRAEADIEYWRSQHDRLNRDLDRERALRVTADKAQSIAESETRVVRERVAQLTVDVSDTQARERALITTEAALQAELDQATMAMGWWSRRRLLKLQARSSGRTPPSPVGD